MNHPTTSSEETFNGFLSPVSNYFRMPNEWINISAKITNLAELKVVEYVLRHTWGYNEYDGKPKPITVDEFMHGRKRIDGSRIDNGTGLSKPSVIQGIKYAIAHGYLTCDIDNRDKARIIKAYSLKMFSSSLGVKDLNPTSRGKTSLPQGSNIFTSEVKDLDIRGKETLLRSEKETLERNSRKKLKERKNDESQQNPNVSAQDDSFLPPSTQSSFSLSEEVKTTYDIICQELYPNCPPNLTTKAIEHFTKLSMYIKTVEDIKSLVAYCRAEQPILNTSKIHPGNLVRWLDGWLLQSRPAIIEEVVEEPVIVVTDEEVADEVLATAQLYQDDDNFEDHLKSIERFKKDFKLNNYDLCDKIINARRRAKPDTGDIQDFFYYLRRTVM